MELYKEELDVYLLCKIEELKSKAKSLDKCLENFTEVIIRYEKELISKKYFRFKTKNRKSWIYLSDYLNEIDYYLKIRVESLNYITVYEKNIRPPLEYQKYLIYIVKFILLIMILYIIII